MNKIKIILLSLFVGFALAGCEQEGPEVWDSATLEYSGRWIVGVYEGTTEIMSGEEIQIYNTAANLPNEVWIDWFNVLKGKCKLNGNAAAFSTASDATNIAPFESAVLKKVKDTIPNAAGQVLPYILAYNQFTVSDGKIVLGGATTPGKNTADAISFKITLKSFTFNYVSVKTDPATWADPTKPEYGWEMDNNSLTYDSSSDEAYDIRGFRYTGFDEDEL